LLTRVFLAIRWDVAEPISDAKIKEFPEIDPAILQLLCNRGLQTQKEIDVFLGPDWDRDVYSHDLFTNMVAAVTRVFQAFEAGEVITVHGDYDADGVCGSAVLVSSLRDIARKLNFDDKKITNYIPHREKEGYGVSPSTMDHLAEHDKTKLVITVDCGISNKEAVDRGKELGIDTIICDHHTMPAELPDQAILIHPLVPGETFPNKKLCGTGVAYKLACGLIDEAKKRGADVPEGHSKWLLDLVAIATVTDVMPLTGENRVLEKFGLIVLNKARRIGIQKLLEVIGSKAGELDTVSIGFQIGPRLNAAGRMTHAQEALELLIEEDELEATKLAMRLQEINKERQKASQAMYLEAEKQLTEAEDQKLLVVWQQGWGAGLVGLVAGKIQNKHGKPVFCVGRDGDKFVGSGRSPEGFDITAAMRHASDHLEKFGGHPQACGFSVHGEEKFLKAVEVMREYAQEHIQEDQLGPSVIIDAEIEIDQIDWPLYDAMQPFRPFGTGNPTPMFVSRGARVVSFSPVGKDGSHLKMRLQGRGGKIVNAIGFRLGHWAEQLKLGDEIDVAFEIQVNEWNGNRELQIRIEDLTK